MLRLRMLLIGIVAVALMVFVVTLLFSRLISTKVYKKWWVKTVLFFLFILGLSGFFLVGKSYYESKYRPNERVNTVVIEGKEIKTKANAQIPLILQTAYDTIENTHPSVVNFSEKWEGYKYWMAVTAYPKGDASKENPHLFGSNDLINWTPPKGVTNPLDEVNSVENDEKGNPRQYNSDNHLLFDKELNQLELFWRYVDDISGKVFIYQSVSKDGKTWSEKKVAAELNRSKGEDWLSPAFVKEKGIYQVWYVAYDHNIYHRTSKDGKTWSKQDKVAISYEQSGMNNWHLDVQKIEDHYEMLVVGFKQKEEGKQTTSDRHTMNLYYSKSDKNNKHWETLKPIIYPSQKPEQWDGKGLYRSSLIKEKDTYYIFYSGIGMNQTRAVGLSYGKDIFNLEGLNYFDTSKFYKEGNK